MTEPITDLWDRVDAYFADSLLPPDADLVATLRNADDQGLPAIQVSDLQGALLEILTRTLGARRVLEIGTLGGYSTLWFARGLVDGGQVVTLELDPHHAATAQSSVDAAGRSHQVEVRVGPAADSLAVLRTERADGAAAFDLVFIDADKASMPQYFVSSLGLVRPGALIVADNVVRQGRVVDAEATEHDPDVAGVREMLALVAVTPGVQATAIQTVGAKGYDGFALVRVDDPAAAEEYHRGN